MGTLPMNKGTIDTPEVAAAKIAKWRESGRIPPSRKSSEVVSVVDRKAPVASTSSVVQIESGIGDCLKTSFDKFEIEFSPSCSCFDLQEILNRTSPESVEEAITEYVEKVAANVRHAKGLRGAVLKSVNWAVPGEVKSRIRVILTECIAKSKAISGTQTET